jgi:hypothetical protein
MEPDMSRTKRVPIGRPTRLQVSAKAIELFEAMEQTTRQRNAASCHDDDSGSGSGHCRADCDACSRWYDAMGDLHDELGLKPWQWPVYARNPFCPGTARARAWRMDAGSQAMWELLNAASKQARRNASPGATHADSDSDLADRRADERSAGGGRNNPE